MHSRGASSYQSYLVVRPAIFVAIGITAGQPRGQLLHGNFGYDYYNIVPVTTSIKRRERDRTRKEFPDVPRSRW